jgi:hypothetical protein
MEAIEANYGAELGVRVSRRRYRLVQAGDVYTRRFRGDASVAEVAELNAGLSTGERLLFTSANATARIMARRLPKPLWNALSRRALGQFPSWDPSREEGRYANVLDVFEHRRSTPEHTLL